MTVQCLSLITKRLITNPLRCLSVLSLPLFLASCGGDSSNSQIAFVTDVRVDPASVRLNQEIGIQVDFEPSQSADFSSDSASLQSSTVVIRLPEGVDYVTGSSQFDGSDVGGFRDRGPNRVDICGDGTRVLSYFFSSGELTDNENKIRLSAVAFQGSGTVTIDAEADDSITIPCGILPQDFDTLVITP